MKYIIVAIVISTSNQQPTRVIGTDKYDTIEDCNYNAMKLVFQMRTPAQWSIRCVAVNQ